MVSRSNKIHIAVVVILALFIASGCCAKKKAPMAEPAPTRIAQAPVVKEKPELIRCP